MFDIIPPVVEDDTEVGGKRINPFSFLSKTLNILPIYGCPSMYK